jgi:serine/threonine-protein kinase
MRADRAGQAQKLLEGRNLVWPASFSPDGRRLAFVLRTLETSFDIWTLPLDTTDPDHPKPGQPEPFLQTAASEMAPAFSPDGHWMAYQSSETGATQIYVRPFPGPGGIRQISTGSGSFPIWSRNGRELFYANRDNRIMVVDYAVHGDSFDAGRPRIWSNRQIGSTVFNPNLDLSYDAKRFVVLTGPKPPQPQTGPAHMVFLLNFFDELRRRIPAGGK